MISVEPVPIAEQFLGFYMMCIERHQQSFPVPRAFSLSHWRDCGTLELVRQLKSLYPRPLQVGNLILTLDWPNRDLNLGPYRIDIQNTLNPRTGVFPVPLPAASMEFNQKGEPRTSDLIVSPR